MIGKILYAGGFAGAASLLRRSASTASLSAGAGGLRPIWGGKPHQGGYGILGSLAGPRLAPDKPRVAGVGLGRMDLPTKIKELQCFPCHLIAEGFNERALYAGLAGFNGSVG
jgi:hypothetical protein